MLTQLRAEANDWVAGQLANALRATSAAHDVAVYYAGQIQELEHGGSLVHSLITYVLGRPVEERPSWHAVKGDERRAVGDGWLKLLAKHEDRLRSGKHLEPHEVPSELLPGSPIEQKK